MTKHDQQLKSGKYTQQEIDLFNEHFDQLKSGKYTQKKIDLFNDGNMSQCLHLSAESLEEIEMTRKILKKKCSAYKKKYLQEAEPGKRKAYKRKIKEYKQEMIGGRVNAQAVLSGLSQAVKKSGDVLGKLITKENMEILDSGKKIFKDSAKVLEQSSSSPEMKKNLEKALQDKSILESIEKALKGL